MNWSSAIGELESLAQTSIHARRALESIKLIGSAAFKNTELLGIITGLCVCLHRQQEMLNEYAKSQPAPMVIVTDDASISNLEWIMRKMRGMR